MKTILRCGVVGCFCGVLLVSGAGATHSGGDKPNEKAKTDDAVILKKLQGKWRPESCEMDGQNIIFLPEGILGTPGLQVKMFVVQDRTWTMISEFLDTESRDNFSIEIDPSKDPKTINLVHKDGEKAEGIFALDGNIMLLCLQNREKQPRPTKFNSRYEKSAWLLILRRVKE